MQLGKHTGGDKKSCATDRSFMYGGTSNQGMPGILRPEKFANSDQRNSLRKKAKLQLIKE